MAIQTLLFVSLCSNTLRLSPRGLSFWVNLGPHSMAASGQSNCLFGDWRLPEQVFQRRKKMLFLLVIYPCHVSILSWCSHKNPSRWEECQSHTGRRACMIGDLLQPFGKYNLPNRSVKKSIRLPVPITFFKDTRSSKICSGWYTWYTQVIDIDWKCT